MTSIAGPSVTHPSWCDPTECGEDRSQSRLLATFHRSAEDTWRSVGGDVTATVQLSRTDTYDGAPDTATAAHLRTTGGEETLPVDQIAALGAWLIAKAAEVRETIATEDGGAGDSGVTVLDDDLNLTVRVDDDVVAMTGNACDGIWYFGPQEARELATALIDHAARLDATYADADARQTATPPVPKSDGQHVGQSNSQAWLDFSDATDAERALIAALTPAELATCTAAAKEAAEAKAAEIRARR